MELVTNRHQIASNLAELERIRRLGAGPEHRDYLSLIKNGICFVAYDDGEGMAFAPSRFIGYVDNTLQKHASNDSKDGRDTNPAIADILHGQPEPDDDLNASYRRFCHKLGIDARDTGNFGVERKFWREVGLRPVRLGDAEGGAA